MGVAVHEDGVDVIGAIVALERRDVRPKVVGWREREREKKQSPKMPLHIPKSKLDSRGTTRTFLFLSLLSARWPAAQSPMENLRVWFVISCEQREDGII